MNVSSLKNTSMTLNSVNNINPSVDSNFNNALLNDKVLPVRMPSNSCLQSDHSTRNTHPGGFSQTDGSHDMRGVSSLTEYLGDAISFSPTLDFRYNPMDDLTLTNQEIERIFNDL